MGDYAYMLVCLCEHDMRAAEKTYVDYFSKGCEQANGRLGMLCGLVKQYHTDFDETADEFCLWCKDHDVPIPPFVIYDEMGMTVWHYINGKLQ